MKKINHAANVGKKFSKLTVLDYFFENKKCYYKCKCDCGNSKNILAYLILKSEVKSCGCYQRECAKELGKKQRKYFGCWYCGSHNHYAQGLCKNCYNRHLRGNLEYHNNKFKKTVPLTEKQIQKLLLFIANNKKMLLKENVILPSSYSKYLRGIAKPTFKTAKKIYNFFGKDIFEELQINKKYKNEKKYKVKEQEK